MGFSERLQELMSENGYTKYRVAKELTMSASTIANYLNGKTRPDITKLEEISRFFGVNRHWLLTGEGDKKRVDSFPINHQNSELGEQGETSLVRLITILEKQTDSLRERDGQITRLIDMNGTLINKLTND